MVARSTSSSLLLVVLICGNVALLLFARAATRESELLVRSALGASRGRIVAQLFAEALVLGGVAAVGRARGRASCARPVGHRVPRERTSARLPVLVRSPPVADDGALRACARRVIGAVVAGVMPALKITRGLGARLKQGTAGGGGVRFGGVWTAVIVAQVAITVVFPAVVVFEQSELQARPDRTTPASRREEYLGVTRSDIDGCGGRATMRARALARFDRPLEALRQRLAAEPGVAGVTFVDASAARHHASWRPHRGRLPPSATTAQPLG